MRIDYGPGYRLYWAEQGATVILLLCGGDKGSQVGDIAKARAMIEEL
jgi:putative addiction module killer protein